MRLNEFMDGFFKSWGTWVGPTKESKENLKKTYAVLQDLEVIGDLTAEQADKIYRLFVDWHNYGARGHSKEER